MIRPALLCVLLVTLASAALPARSAPDLRTVSERSGFTATGRYAEVEKLCPAFQKAYPGAVRCIAFGRTPENRVMLALVVTRSGAFTAKEAQARGLPVTLIQGGIHAGEIDGKDAGFQAVQQILDGKLAPGVLDRQVLIFVPVFNVDGHERFAKNNRPNQRGPAEMGWRSTAQNFNLNRDYVKADAPEMQAMLALVNSWDPLAYVDLHVTDGAKFQHDVSIQVEPVFSGDTRLRAAGLAWKQAVIDDLTRQGSQPQPFYMSFATDDDPASGFIDGVSEPRFSTGYFQLRNRLVMLVETHSWKDYPTRVRITHNAFISVLEQVAVHGRQWRQMALAADARAMQQGGKPVVLTWKATDRATMIDFKGYAYTRTMSDVSGALMTRYDDTTPQIWHVPLRDEVVPDLVVTAPRAGYLVPAAYAASVGQKLARHGIVFHTVEHAFDALDAETFRADDAVFGTISIESHQRLALKGAWRREQRNVGKGALFVPIAQPKALLVAAMLEPQAPDSLLAWGEFNTAFERKEYMEDYVAEEVAREQLAADPALATAFRDKLASDAAFAKDARARLEFFARRHASWDERLNLYPVMRVDLAPDGARALPNGLPRAH